MHNIWGARDVCVKNGRNGAACRSGQKPHAAEAAEDLRLLRVKQHPVVAGFEDFGKHTLKGIPEAWHVFRAIG